MLMSDGGSRALASLLNRLMGIGAEGFDLFSRFQL